MRSGDRQKVTRSSIISSSSELIRLISVRAADISSTAFQQSHVRNSGNMIGARKHVSWLTIGHDRSLHSHSGGNSEIPIRGSTWVWGQYSYTLKVMMQNDGPWEFSESQTRGDVDKHAAPALPHSSSRGSTLRTATNTRQCRSSLKLVRRPPYIT